MIFMMYTDRGVSWFHYVHPRESATLSLTCPLWLCIGSWHWSKAFQLSQNKTKRKLGTSPLFIAIRYISFHYDWATYLITIRQIMRCTMSTGPTMLLDVLSTQVGQVGAPKSKFSNSQYLILDTQELSTISTTKWQPCYVVGACTIWAQWPLNCSSC